jgi:hypothetical protein
MFLKTSRDGELFVDHRASPGIPAEIAVKMGYHPDQVRAGKSATIPTLGCPHCGGHQVKNPWRTRERAHCYVCNVYICDGCYLETRMPDYKHETFLQKCERMARESQRKLILP